jgi:hypothetical protein
MTIAISISVLAGMAIGFRFKIYMVVPAILTAALSTAAVYMAQGDQFWSIAWGGALSVVAVQVGYLCGTFVLSMKEAPVAHTAQAAGAPADVYRSRTRISA